MKIAMCLAVLLASAVWADEANDRAAIEKTISALNTSPNPSELFTTDFPNAAELQLVRFPGIARLPAEGTTIRSSAGTVVISREPMGEATWYPGLPSPSASSSLAITPRFRIRSITFIAPDTAVVIAVRTRPFAPQDVPVLFVLKNVLRNEGSDWRIASFRVLSEAQTKAPL